MSGDDSYFKVGKRSVEVDPMPTVDESSQLGPVASSNGRVGGPRSR